MDWSKVLHLLAHEMRSPATVIAGYTRMLQEGRLSDEQRVRALDQMQRAATTLAVLSRQASTLANWLEPDPNATVEPADAGHLVDAAIARLTSRDRVSIDARAAESGVLVRSLQGEALASALAAVIEAVGRDEPEGPIAVVLPGPDAEAQDIWVGPAGVVASGPPPMELREPVPLDRGGLGLSLVVAAAVFDVHRARLWRAPGNVIGVTLPRHAHA